MVNSTYCRGELTKASAKTKTLQGSLPVYHKQRVCFQKSNKHLLDVLILWTLFWTTKNEKPIQVTYPTLWLKQKHCWLGLSKSMASVNQQKSTDRTKFLENTHLCDNIKNICGKILHAGFNNRFKLTDWCVVSRQSFVSADMSDRSPW